MKKIIDTLKIETDEEVKKFENILSSFLVDSTSTRENAEIIYKIYSDSNNLKLIDSKYNNQKAIYIALNGENDKLFSLLLSGIVKNKNYSMLELDRTPVVADLDNMLLLTAQDILKENPSFNTSDIKAKKRFTAFCVEYFTYKCSSDNISENPEEFEKNLFKIIDLLNINYEKNQWQIMSSLLLFNAHRPFINLLNSIKSKTKKIILLDIISPPEQLETNLNNESFHLIKTLKLNCSLDKTLTKKNIKTKNKFKL